MSKDEEKGISTFFFPFGCSIRIHIIFKISYFSLLIGMDPDDVYKEELSGNDSKMYDY